MTATKYTGPITPPATPCPAGCTGHGDNPDTADGWYVPAFEDDSYYRPHTRVEGIVKVTLGEVSGSDGYSSVLGLDLLEDEIEGVEAIESLIGDLQRAVGLVRDQSPQSVVDDCVNALVSRFNSAREARGLTNAELASRTGIPLASLVRRLAGHSELTVRGVALLAGALGMTVHQLMTAPTQ